MNPPLDGGQHRTSRGRPGSPVDAYRLQRALRQGFWLLVASGVGGLVLGFLCAKFLVVNSFEATALLRYEGMPAIASLPEQDVEAMGPAAEALLSQPVLRRIADEIEFDDSLMALESIMDYSVDLQTGTLHIDVSDDDAEGVEEFSLAAANVFIAYQEEQQTKRIEAELQSTRKRMRAAEREADLARGEYNKFREEHGIANLSTQQQSTLDSAAKLRAKSELAVSDIRALEARVKSLEAQLASTPKTKVVSSGKSPERAQYQKLRAELAAAKSTLSDNHPRVQALRQQVAQLRQQLKSGNSGGGDTKVATNTTYRRVEQQLRTAQANLEAAREQQKGLVELAGQAQGRVEAFSAIEGDATGLLAQVKVSEGLVGELQGDEARLEDALREPSSGFVILDAGSAPEYAARNKMKFVVLGGVPIVLFGLALLFVLWREFRGLRVRTAAEVAFWGNGPVIGTTMWPNDPHGLEDLVASLDDFAPDATGSVLIVGGSPHEAQLAQELATRMKHDWFITNPHTGDEHAVHPATQAQPSMPSQPSGPIATPPPSAPYPFSATKNSPATALARRPAQDARIVGQPTAPLEPVAVDIEAWEGPHEGQPLRRAARLAQRVIVLVHSGAATFMDLMAVDQRLGRQRGVGYVVVGLQEELVRLHDRAGDVEGFWGRR